MSNCVDIKCVKIKDKSYIMLSVQKFYCKRKKKKEEGNMAESPNEIRIFFDRIMDVAESISEDKEQEEE